MYEIIKVSTKKNVWYTIVVALNKMFGARHVLKAELGVPFVVIIVILELGPP